MNQVVDATYVINLDRDQDRLQVFTQMMAASAWPFERFPAIHGKTFADKTVKSKYLSSLHFLNESEQGCLLSHVALWEKVANDPALHRIAIFEDDARTHVTGSTVHDLLTGFYAYLEEQGLDEPDMLYLGKSLDNCAQYEQVWGHVYRSIRPQCLHAYILTKAGARQLLSQAPYREAIDMVPIATIGRGLLQVMVLHPSLYFQDIIGTTSNLRKLNSALNNTTECLVSQQYISGETWGYVVVLIIGLIAVLVLYVWWFWR